jgi:hypothetical protein
MARYEVDRDGVAAARVAVGGDPEALRAVADAVAAATSAARVGLGPRTSVLAVELDRFRLVHARLLDAMADAVAALCGELDLAMHSERDVELAAVSALGSLTGAVGQAARGGEGR